MRAWTRVHTLCEPCEPTSWGLSWVATHTTQLSKLTCMICTLSPLCSPKRDMCSLSGLWPHAHGAVAGPSSGMHANTWLVWAGTAHPSPSIWRPEASLAALPNSLWAIALAAPGDLSMLGDYPLDCLGRLTARTGPRARSCLSSRGLRLDPTVILGSHPRQFDCAPGWSRPRCPSPPFRKANSAAVKLTHERMRVISAYLLVRRRSGGSAAVGPM